MLNRYFNNGWIEPIVIEARPILDSFVPETAIGIASAVLQTIDGGDPEIPWATVFPSDERDLVAQRLLRVLQTPDNETPAYNDDTFLAVQNLQQILNKHDAVGHVGAHATYHLVQVAAGKRNEHFTTYSDLARKWPQYATDWYRKLRSQFGGLPGEDEVLGKSPELERKLAATVRAADTHYKVQGEIRQPGEPTPGLISRSLAFFDVSTVEGLEEANRILSAGFIGYRSEAYHIRGLTAPSE